MEMKLNAIGIVVADIKRSIGFYQRLGCDFDDDNTIHVEAKLGDFKLMLDGEQFLRDNGFLSGEIGARTGTALAVQCDSAQTVDTLYTELAGLGEGVREPFDAPWGQRYCTVHDPDGTPVDLYAWLPGHPQD